MMFRFTYLTMEGMVKIMSKIVLAPQKGPQEMFLATSADVCIYGGAAGGGKTFGLLLEPLRHKNNPNFNAVIFRRNYTQVTSPGGLWDSSRKVYSLVKGAFPLKTPKLHWTFQKGASVNFAHLGSDEDCDNWQGSQITMIGFDELTHFTEYQFFYMLSRNRTDSGVAPYIRATCNPDADSWVANFISWWIDQNTGYPIQERSGVIRWMVRLNEVVTWFDSREDAVKGAIENGIEPEEAETMPKSVTFIASTLQDNKILMKNDPGYLANLKALALVERERLLYGNWKIKAQAGRFFKRTQIKSEGYFEKLPDDVIFWCRAWDIAATDEDENGDPAYTAGVLIGKRENRRFIVADVVNQRIKAGDVESLILMTAISDRAKYGANYRIRIPQDPGAAGKIVAKQYLNHLAGFDVKAIPVSGSKELRATPFAAQWQNGFVDVLIADWNEGYFRQLESFPDSKFKDMVDASADAFNELADENFNIDSLL